MKTLNIGNRIKKNNYNTGQKKVLEIFLPLWVKIPFLRIIYILVAFVIGSALFVLFYGLYTQLIPFPFDMSTLKANVDKVDSNLALAFVGTITGLVALFGGWLAILRSETTERQTYTEEQKLILQRLSDAKEGLDKNNDKGEPAVGARVDALFALEENANNSIRNHIRIMEMLSAYIRSNAPLVSSKNKPTEPREDIRLALAIIGRRKTWSNSKTRIKLEEEQGYRIDLRNRHLQGIQLTNAYLKGAVLNGADLSHAVLRGINFSEASLNNANLSYAEMMGANLKNASLNNAILIKTLLDRANLIKATANNATMTGVQLNTADLTEASFKRADLKKAYISLTYLGKAQLQGANLSEAWMSGAYLEEADLTETNMSRADMGRTNLTNTRFKNTNMKDVMIDEAFIYEGDLRECSNFIPKQLEETFCGKKVKLPTKGYKPDPASPTHDVPEDKFIKLFVQWLKERKERPYDPNSPYSGKWKASIFGV